MDINFDLPHIGKLTTEHVFYHYGYEPILFVCTDKNGIRYLCSCCTLGEVWIVGRTEASVLLDLIDNKITIREVYESPNNPVLFVAWDGKRYSLIDSSYDHLPLVGAFLELAHERTGTYRKTLEQSCIT